MDENEKIVIMTEDGKPDKWANAKVKIKNGVRKVATTTGKVAKGAWQFYVDNQANVTAFLASAGAAIALISKFKPTKTEKYRDEVDLSIYDYRTHTRFHLKRPLTNRENVEYLTRLERGENSYDILNDMRVLKWW